MAVFRTNPKRIIADTAFSARLGMMVIDRLRDVKREEFDNVLWVGGGDANDLKIYKTISSIEQRAFPVEGAIDRFPYDENTFDLIIVTGGLNVVNDLPGALVQMKRALKPDGLFMCVLPGGETLYELRDSQMRVETKLKSGAAPRVHPMIDLQTFAGLMQRAGFALPVADAEKKEIFYEKFPVMLRDIKNSGEGMTLANASPYPGKTFWNEVEADYRAHHLDHDGLLRMTVEIIHGIGWGPADSQQKPLKPGSATGRLADVLGTSETKLPR